MATLQAWSRRSSLEERAKSGGLTGLEPGSPRRGNHLTACELWSQHADCSQLRVPTIFRSTLDESSRIDPIRGDILETDV